MRASAKFLIAFILILLAGNGFARHGYLHSSLSSKISGTQTGGHLLLSATVETKHPGKTGLSQSQDYFVDEDDDDDGSELKKYFRSHHHLSALCSQLIVALHNRLAKTSIPLFSTFSFHSGDVYLENRVLRI